MRIGVSWLREYVDLPADLTAAALEQALVDARHRGRVHRGPGGDACRARWSSAGS